ncbi:hypothetical protein HK104_008221 [Borealophlyctis nickersoniae]|nr:hypothetical protein HK104_008221 [Borealophlyctis nickersoniae]
MVSSSAASRPPPPAYSPTPEPTTPLPQSPQLPSPVVELQPPSPDVAPQPPSPDVAPQPPSPDAAPQPPSPDIAPQTLPTLIVTHQFDIKPRNVKEASQTLYRVIVDYDPQIDDELALRVGEIISLSHHHGDGWATGTNLTTHSTGAFPLPAVTLCSQPPASPITTLPSPAPSPTTHIYVSLEALDVALASGRITGPEYLKWRKRIEELRVLDEMLTNGEVEGAEYLRMRKEVEESVWA